VLAATVGASVTGTGVAADVGESTKVGALVEGDIVELARVGASRLDASVLDSVAAAVGTPV